MTGPRAPLAQPGFDLADGGLGGVADSRGALAGMGAVTYEPQVLEGGAVGKTEGAEGADAHAQATHRAAIARRKPLKCTGSPGLDMHQMIGPQIKKLAEARDRGVGVLLFQRGIVIGLLPLG